MNILKRGSHTNNREIQGNIMQVKTMILGLMMITTVSLSWAQESAVPAEPQTASSSTPAVILPQDDNSIDAALDDHEFDLSPSDQPTK